MKFSFIELQVMIQLIEVEYLPQEKSTADKMLIIIKKEFGKVISEQDILHFYNLGEDYEKINREIEHGSNF